MRQTVICALVLALAGVPAAFADQANDPAFAEVRTGITSSVPAEFTDTELSSSRGEVRYANVLDEAAVAPPAAPADAGRDVETPRGGLDWGNDILIRGGSSFPGDRGRLSIDHAANGDIYVGVKTEYGAPQDTFHVFRSTNHGATWQVWAHCINAAGNDSIVDAKLIVGPGANPWVYMFVHYSTSDGGLYVRRMRADGTGNLWSRITRGDSARKFDVDRNIENPPVLFLTYNELNAGVHNRVRLFASYDSSATWTNGRNVATGTGNPVALCAGGDGYCYLAWVDDSITPWVGRYTNNLVSPTFTFAHPDSVAGDFVYQPTIAAARTAPGGSQVAWILNRHRHTNGNYDLHVSHTTNGGVSWTTAPWPPTEVVPRTEWDMRHPTLRYPYDYNVQLSVASATLYGGFDSVITAFARVATPTVWEGREVVNDHDCTGAFPSVVDCILGSGGSTVAYRQYGSPEVWFDYWWGTGLAEEKRPVGPAAGRGIEVTPNPAAGRAQVRFALESAGPVELALFDAAGRKLAVLARGPMSAGGHAAGLDCRGLEAGVYLVRLAADGRADTRRFVVAR
jgi:hypothetical protein